MLPGAFLSSSTTTIAAVGICTTAFAAILTFTSLVESAEHKVGLARASLCGLVLCVLAPVVSFPPLLILTVAWTLIVILATAATVASVGEAVTFTNPLTRLGSASARGPWARTAVPGLILVLSVAVVAVVTLSDSAKEDSPASIFVSGRYRVSGTCVNGACTVNECSTPAPCGLDNHGRLHEGAPLDIVCQTGGEVAKAPNQRRSKIWDRLQSGLYVSDLFVEGTATGRFTSSLRRCASG